MSGPSPTADTAAAVLSRLAAHGVPAVDTPPTSAATYPYCVVYFDAGFFQSDRVADKRTRLDLGWQTTVVGVTAGQCRALLDRVSVALGDWRPTVTGRDFGKVAHDGSQPTRRDPDMPDRVLYIATDQWRVLSDPAA